MSESVEKKRFTFLASAKVKTFFYVLSDFFIFLLLCINITNIIHGNFKNGKILIFRTPVIANLRQWDN